MGGEGRRPSGAGVLEFLGFVLSFVALDVPVPRFGRDSGTLTRELPYAGHIEPTEFHPEPDHAPPSYDSA
jgi:hypothetical protein